MSLGVGIATGLYGISFGALAVAAGLEIWQAQLLSILMFSGGSQFAFIGVVASGGLASLPASIASAWLLGIRNGFYALQMKPLLGVLGWKTPIAAQFNIDFSVYKQEVDELLISCESLQKREEKYKAKVSALWNQSQILKTQLDIALHAREEAKLDFDYANSTGEQIDCPTCGAHYTNSFAERFSIAIDEDHCAGLALTLKDELSEVQRKLAKEVESSMKVAEELAAIEKLLAKREGEIALGDLIQQEGRRELREVMNDDLGGLRDAEGQQSSRIHDAEQQMKSLDNRERRREVNGFYEDKMRLFLNDLDVQSVQDKAIKKVDRTISDTGSELPRALLAQQFAMLHVIKKFGSAAFAPILIDSPNQQDQDDKHLARILRFIRDRRPANSQLILALVDTPGVDFEGQEVVLDKKHSLLQEKDFAEVGNEVQEFIDAALSS
jgi:hypothetical protein